MISTIARIWKRKNSIIVSDTNRCFVARGVPQKQTALIRQLEEELRIAHMQRNPDAELQSHLDALYAEKEHMTKEIFLLRETIKVSLSHI